MGTGYDDDFDFDDDQNGQEPNIVKQLRKQLKEKERENKTLNERLTTLETQTRTSSLAKLLEAKNVNPKAAKFYPSDLPVDEESLTKWLAEDGDVFAPAAPPQEGEQQTAEEETPGEGEQPQETPPWMGQFERIQRNEVAGQTLAPKSSEAAAQSLQSAAANAKSSQDFLAWLQSGGAGS